MNDTSTTLTSATPEKPEEETFTHTLSDQEIITRTISDEALEAAAGATKAAGGSCGSFDSRFYTCYPGG
jgi:hypothetical protein